MTDTAAYTELFRAYWAVVCEAAKEVLGCDDEAEDVAQRVFMRLWNSGGWRVITQPERFFRAAGRHQAFNTLRGQRRRRSLGLRAQQSLSLVRDHANPEEALERAERAAAVARAIGTLPTRYRLVSALVFGEGMTTGEAARQLGVSVKAIEKQLSRARSLLAEVVGTNVLRGVHSSGRGGDALAGVLLISA